MIKRILQSGLAIALSAVLTMVWCFPLRAADAPARIFWQAEGMTVSNATAWKVVEHFPYWYKDVPLEKMLRGSKGGAGEPVAVLSPVQSVEQKDGALVMTLDVAEFEFIAIPKENAK